MQGSSQSKGDVRRRRADIKTTTVSGSQGFKKISQPPNSAIPNYSGNARTNTEKSGEVMLYDDHYDNNDRCFVYFISRIAIVYDPLTNEQRFYEGHKSKITCMAVHPSSNLLALNILTFFKSRVYYRDRRCQSITNNSYMECPKFAAIKSR